MIRRPIRPAAVFYRMHTPRWALSPLSGAGAARHGGRFNRPGVEALYLSAEAPTAIAEYQQDDLLMPPGTLVAYQVTLSDVVDFAAGFDPQAWSSEWRDWDQDWREAWILRQQQPPSWRLWDAAVAAGAQGMLFPSLAARGGTNLVVYQAALSVAGHVVVHDPDGRLPRNARSWSPTSQDAWLRWRVA